MKVETPDVWAQIEHVRVKDGVWSASPSTLRGN